MVHLIKYIKGVTEYGNIDGLFDGISLRQIDGTIMGYAVIFVYGEVNMSNMESVI